MKARAAWTGIGFVLALAAVVFVHLFTLRLEPGRGLSGNGNPGLIPLFFVFLFYPLLLLLTARLLRGSAAATRGRSAQNALSGLALIVLLLLDAAYIRRKTAHLDLIPEFGALNIYTNTIYANVYHFFIGLVMLHLVILNTRWGGRKVPLRSAEQPDPYGTVIDCGGEERRR
ncbi:hypothetical protein [Paenibacillus humicus]|uniref:hypothetical protein n=1 Tax=Paenibacillus humicus TaxID=412861 RepID=UPI0013E36512|nr:hypothetical protein [Paenibacillus humicus]